MKPQHEAPQVESGVPARAPTRSLSAWEVVPPIVLVLLLLFVALRLAGVVALPWAIVLAPLSLTGVVALVAIAITMNRHRLAEWRLRLTGRSAADLEVTPVPEKLEQPRGATSVDTRILQQNPELLAALCLGFRKKRLVPEVLGRPVVDVWGVYNAALTASAGDLHELQMVARMHMQAYVKEGQRRGRRSLSDAAAMRHAVEHFRRCAETTTRRGGNPDCPFEHVVVVFGSQSPKRDANLKSVAPRVRSLLEHQYPQLATATLDDGSAVKFDEWQEQASRDRKELKGIRKELDRTARALQETTAELDSARAETAALRDGLDRQRSEMRTAARREQEKALADLQATIDRNAQEHTRSVQRLEGEVDRLHEALVSLAAERDTLEKALFAADADEETGGDSIDAASLAGVRVLLVGGDARMVVPIREHAEANGIQLLHDDTMNAAQLVSGADMVVFWIRYLSHPKYFGVRRECRVSGTTHCYWTRTSPSSLVSLVAQTRNGSAAAQVPSDSAH